MPRFVDCVAFPVGFCGAGRGLLVGSGGSVFAKLRGRVCGRRGGSIAVISPSGEAVCVGFKTGEALVVTAGGVEVSAAFGLDVVSIGLAVFVAVASIGVLGLTDDAVAVSICGVAETVTEFVMAEILGTVARIVSSSGGFGVCVVVVVCAATGLGAVITSFGTGACLVGSGCTGSEMVSIS